MVSKRRTDPGYGQGQVTIELDDDVLLDEERLTSRLLEVFQKPDYRPPTLPSVAVELMALSQNPDVSFDQVVSLLERDSMLTGRLMKLLRSPIYAPPGASSPPSLKNAVVRLGLNTLRDVVLETCMNMRVFRADAFTDTMERLRLHSTLTGHIARTICRYTTMEGEYAFLCGLMHDVGVAGTLIALTEAFPKDRRPDLIAIWPAIDRAHAQAGALMTKLWELPADVEWSVGNHHRVNIDGYPHPMAATVCLAEELARELGYGLAAPEGKTPEGTGALEAACLQSYTELDRSSPKTLELAREALQLADAQMELIRSDAEELTEKLSS